MRAKSAMIDPTARDTSPGATKNQSTASAAAVLDRHSRSVSTYNSGRRSAKLAIVTSLPIRVKFLLNTRSNEAQRPGRAAHIWIELRRLGSTSAIDRA